MGDTLRLVGAAVFSILLLNASAFFAWEKVFYQPKPRFVKKMKRTGKKKRKENAPT